MNESYLSQDICFKLSEYIKDKHFNTAFKEFCTSDCFGFRFWLGGLRGFEKELSSMLRLK